MDKKNFCLKGQEYSIVIATNNYLEYYTKYLKSDILIRKRIYKGFNKSKNFDELEKISHKYFAELNNKKLAEYVPETRLHEYMELNKHRFKPRSYTQFLGVINRFNTFCKKQKIKPENITFYQAQLYVQSMAKDKSNGTLFNNILVLKSIYNGLVKMKFSKENVFAQIPKFKRNPTSLMYYNTKQITSIKKHLMEHDRQLYRAIILLYSCAIRPAELITLKLYNINIEDGLIEIESTNSKNSKTQKVVMPKYIIKELAFINNMPNHYYLFTKSGTPGEVKLGDNYLNNHHRKILKELKINGRYALYSWKHTGAVAMVRAGINIKQIQIQFRHSSLDMTNEYLKNLGVSDNLDLIDKLPEI